MANESPRFAENVPCLMIEDADTGYLIRAKGRDGQLLTLPEGNNGIITLSGQADDTETAVPLTVVSAEVLLKNIDNANDLYMRPALTDDLFTLGAGESIGFSAAIEEIYLSTGSSLTCDWQAIVSYSA